MVRFGPAAGYRIPGSQDRRIPREHLIKFLKEHGMPLGELEEEGLHKILIIGADKIFIDRIKELLPEERRFQVRAGQQRLRSRHPGGELPSGHHHHRHGDGPLRSLADRQQSCATTAYEQTLIIALASEDEAAPETLVNYGFNEAFKKPFDVVLLGERIRSLVEEKRANM